MTPCRRVLPAGMRVKRRFPARRIASSPDPGTSLKEQEVQPGEPRAWASDGGRGWGVDEEEHERVRHRFRVGTAAHPCGGHTGGATTASWSTQVVASHREEQLGRRGRGRQHARGEPEAQLGESPLRPAGGWNAPRESSGGHRRGNAARRCRRSFGEAPAQSRRGGFGRFLGALLQYLVLVFGPGGLQLKPNPSSPPAALGPECGPRLRHRAAPPAPPSRARGFSRHREHSSVLR